MPIAAAAARRALDRSGHDPAAIGMCVVGTETGVDQSKSIAAFLHGMLGLGPRCRLFEAKQACYGATAGLLAAVEWVHAHPGARRAALVVATDVARYPLNTPAEPTQGAGAVAMIVTPSPRLLELEVGVSGAFARDVDDFWRPVYRKEGVVPDGHYANDCYLEALSGAYGAWKDACREAGLGTALDRSLYHVPYGKMAKKAHRHRLAEDGVGEKEADAAFATEVAASLVFPSVIGNAYAGSLYLSLASLLDRERAALEGKRVGLYSYGSGCSAEFFAGRVPAGAGEHVRALELAAPLEARRRLSIAEYEGIRELDLDVDRAPYGSIGRSAARGARGIAFLGVHEDRRIYSDEPEPVRAQRRHAGA
jgi:hydroxymethylglutaryl-CoA synthase